MKKITAAIALALCTVTAKAEQIHPPFNADGMFWWDLGYGLLIFFAFIFVAYIGIRTFIKFWQWLHKGD